MSKVDKYKNYPPACVIAFVCLKYLVKEGFWRIARYKRPITRLFYMLTGSFQSGWVSKEALQLSAKERCHDHALPPQVICYFLLDNWNSYNNIELFYALWRKVSTTIAVTKQQNNDLSGFSHNSEETGNVLKISSLTSERYRELGIDIYNDHPLEGWWRPEDEPFPLSLGKEHEEYEEEYMLI